MPIAVHRICQARGDSTTGVEVVPAEHLLICDLCGVATSFELLPPLLLHSGAKSTCHFHRCQRDGEDDPLRGPCVRSVDQAILIDADLLWSVNPAHGDPDFPG